MRYLFFFLVGLTFPFPAFSSNVFTNSSEGNAALYTTKTAACNGAYDYQIIHNNRYPEFSGQATATGTTQGWCNAPYAPNFSQWVQSSGTCPSGYEDLGSGNCTVIPEPVCPVPGTQTTFYADFATGPSSAFPLVSVNGCEVTMTSIGERGCKNYIDKQGASCDYKGEFTGNEGSDNPTVDPSTIKKPDSPSQPDDNLTNTKTETLVSDTTVQNPDGSTTKTTVEQTVETQKSGTQIFEDAENTYVQVSNGIVKTTNKTTGEVTYSDGSSSKTIRTDWDKVSQPTETHIIPKDTTPSIVATTQQKTTSGTTTVTNNYSSSGQQTSSTTTGDSNGEGGNGEEGENSITSNQGEFESGEGSWWESSYEDGLEGIWQKHQATLNSSSSKQWFDSWSFPSGGAIPVWNLSFWRISGSYSLTIPQYIWNILGAIMMFYAAVAARKIVFGG